MSGGSKDQVVTNETIIPDEFLAGSEFIIDRATELGESGGSIVSPLSGQTTDAISNLGSIDPTVLSAMQQAASGGFGGTANDALTATAAGDFIGGDSAGLQSVLQQAAEQAQRQVSDQFTSAGRTGSAANANAISSGVADATGQILLNNYQTERANQLNAANSLSTLSQQDIATQLQGASGLNTLLNQSTTDQLAGGQLLDAQANAELLAPYQQLQLLANPIASAVSGAPVTSTQTTPTTGSSAGSVLGGAASGASLGSFAGPIGTGVGAVAGGLLGLFG